MQQRFDGPTLEAALEAAVRALGPDLQVVDARRVRTGGVAGFFSREQYEVIAGPGPVREPGPAAGAPTGLPAPAAAPAQPAASPPDAAAGETALQASIDATIKALIEDVERRSDLAGAPRFADVLAGAAAQGATQPDALPPVIDAEPEPPEEELVDEGRADGAGGPDVATAPRVLSAPPSASASRAAQPVARSDDEPEAVVDDAPRWSRQALRRLGVPAAIIQRLPSERIATDALWIAALTDAIAAEVPRPAEPGPDAELCVSGYGAQAAVKLLQAAVQGFTPGTLCLDGEVLPATPVVLALAVRACLPR
jgi:hypothetical protein